jgi:hypothetical protein
MWTDYRALLLLLLLLLRLLVPVLFIPIQDAAAAAGTAANSPHCCGVLIFSAGRCMSAMLAKVMPHLNAGAQK